MARVTSIMTASLAARSLGITTNRLRALAKIHNVGEQVGGLWLFTKEDVERLRARQDRRTAQARKAAGR